MADKNLLLAGAMHMIDLQNLTSGQICRNRKLNHGGFAKVLQPTKGFVPTHLLGTPQKGQSERKNKRHITSCQKPTAMRSTPHMPN